MTRKSSLDLITSGLTQEGEAHDFQTVFGMVFLQTGVTFFDYVGNLVARLK